MKTLISPTAYARHRHCTRQYISRLIQVGLIPTNHGKIDPLKADEALAKAKDPARGLSKPGSVHTFAEARTNREFFKAKLAELEWGRLKGELVPVNSVITFWANMITACRSRLLAIPTTLAATLFSFKTMPEMKGALEEAIREALTELAAIDAKDLVLEHDRYRRRGAWIRR